MLPMHTDYLLSILHHIPRNTLASTCGSLARSLIKKVMTTEEVSWPATMVMVTLSIISCSLIPASSLSSLQLAVLSRQVKRSDCGEIRACRRASLFTPTNFLIILCTLLLAFKLRLNRVSGRLMGTAHIPNIISSNPFAKSWRKEPSSKPRRRELRISNVKVFINGITCKSRLCETVVFKYMMILSYTY